MSNDPIKVTQNPVVAAKQEQNGAETKAGVVTEVKPETPNPELTKLIKEVFQLKQQVAATVRVAAKAENSVDKVDWTKISEKDITNLNIPIQTIQQDAPEFLNVKLLDKNYIPRWVHILPERLGVCLATGWSFVIPEDLDPQFPKFLNFDANDHYAYGDTVCLKILKSRYFGAIKRNYLKTMTIHGKGQVQAKMNQEIGKDDRLASAIHRDAMSFYEPEDMKGQEVSSELFAKSL
jgi:hypothetical protein